MYAIRSYYEVPVNVLQDRQSIPRIQGKGIVVNPFGVLQGIFEIRYRFASLTPVPREFGNEPEGMVFPRGNPRFLEAVEHVPRQGQVV